MKYIIKNICCIGAGYVGGPTMAVIASHCPNIQINVIDINQERINAWNDDNLKNLPIFEPGLDALIKKCRDINLHFSCEIEKHIANADMIFISVNTPTKAKGLGAGQAIDLKWIDATARQISKYARGKTIVVEKSTLPVKTARTIKEILGSKNSDRENYQDKYSEFVVLSNPEFLSEGTAINNLQNPDRVLIGGEDLKAINSLAEIYSNWIEKEKIITTNLWSSELSKLTANAFLAQRISSINSISALCEATGADINEVSLAIGSDRRIGKEFLKSGPGFGGSCFKKDILNLIYLCNHYGLREVSDYWQKVLDLNEWQTQRISKIVVEKLFGTISGKKIAILGFAFKANTNDTRESPAINICKELLDEGGMISIYDPKVNVNQIKSELGAEKYDFSNNLDGSWRFAETIIDASHNADAIIIVTEWDEFNNIDWNTISKIMRHPAWLFDTRSFKNSYEASDYGINVWMLGNGLKEKIER